MATTGNNSDSEAKVSDLETKISVAEAAESKKQAKLDADVADPDEDQGLELLKANAIGNKSN